MADEPEHSSDGPLDRAIAILTFVAEQKKALSAAEIASALTLRAGAALDFTHGNPLLHLSALA